MNVDSLTTLIAQPQQFASAGAPFICDWPLMRSSILHLASLQPRVLACGHGEPMLGADLPQQFAAYAEDFPIPEHGRYVDEGARTDETGVVWLPPAPADPMPKIAAGLALLGAGLLMRRKIARR
jgi:hypothetical protein